MNSRLALSFRPVVLLLCISGAGVLLCSAEHPTPTPTQTPTGGEKSLSDIAKSKQLKGGEEGKSIVITNENLPDYASQGELTMTTQGQKQAIRPVHGAGTVVKSSNNAHEAERMRYWQTRYQRQMELVASLKQQIAAFDYQIPGLWRDFYAWDDPVYRDSVIKPKIDQAMKERDALEVKLQKEEQRLKEIKETARQDGAEPGWFRGIKAPTVPPVSPTPEMLVY